MSCSVYGRAFRPTTSRRQERTYYEYISCVCGMNRKCVLRDTNAVQLYRTNDIGDMRQHTFYKLSDANLYFSV